MKLSLRLIFFLVLGISIVTFFVARFEVDEQKLALRADLARRAEILSQSLQEIIEPTLEAGAQSQLKRIVERFSNRERLAGVAVYDAKGDVLAESPALRATLGSVPPLILPQQLGSQGTGQFIPVGDKSMHAYFLRLRDGAAGAQALAIFHDATYIEAQSARIWRNTLWHVIVQVLLIVLITLLIIRWTIVSPIARTAQWLKDLRTGKPATRPELPDDDLFKPLSQEVSSLAHSLVQARAVAEEEARLRETGESRWTAERLRVSMQRRLRGSPLFVVSNREPYEHMRRGKTIEAVVPASGLVTALEPILRACNGTWIAHGSGDADPETVDSQDRVRVPPERPQYTLRRVWLSPEELAGYYFGFANEGLWPLCHIAHTRPSFRAEDWELYRSVNRRFAEVVLEEMEVAEEPIVLVQDYHFGLLPRLIKKSRPEARVALFWHIPWPNPEAFGICPWQKELLDGLLGADLLSFHIQSHCNNFLDTVERGLECRVDWEHFAVDRQNHLTAVRAHPISVAFAEATGLRKTEEKRRFDREAFLKRAGLETLFLAVGVDRIDYTKGILERLRGVECFLEKNPSYREQFVFVQIGAPSRTRIKRYQDLVAEVETETQRINARFRTDRWEPIVLLKRHHSHQEIEPFYRAADLCLVTSLHDGMNLVAKEFVAARDDEDGALVLSQFTGASRELQDALIVNPYDTGQLAEAIRTALVMPPEERKARMRRMRHAVKEHNVYRWAAELMSELAEIRLDKPQMVRAG